MKRDDGEYYERERERERERESKNHANYGWLRNVFQEIVSFFPCPHHTVSLAGKAALVKKTHWLT
jgi:hypothetical protein